jgi:dTMP kinase
VLLDLEPAAARQRRGGRAAEDRLESEQDDFHERVRTAFLALATAAPERFVVVDAALPEQEVAARIRAAVEPRLGA